MAYPANEQSGPPVLVGRTASISKVVPSHVPVKSPWQVPTQAETSTLWIVKVPLPTGPSVKDIGYGGLISGELSNTIVWHIKFSGERWDNSIAAGVPLLSIVIVKLQLMLRPVYASITPTSVPVDGAAFATFDPRSADGKIKNFAKRFMVHPLILMLFLLRVDVWGVNFKKFTRYQETLFGVLVAL